MIWISFCKFYRPQTKWAKFGNFGFFRKIPDELTESKFGFLNEKGAKFGRKTGRWMEVVLPGAGCPGLMAGCPGSESVDGFEDI